MKNLYNFNKAKFWLFCFVAAIGILNGLIQILASYVFLPFFQLLLIPEMNSSVQNYIPNFLLFINSNIYILGIAIIFIQFLAFIFSLGSNFLRNKYIIGLNHYFSNLMLKIYLSFPYSKFDNQSTGEQSKKIIFDAQQISQVYYGAILDLIIGFATIIVFILFLGIKSIVFICLSIALILTIIFLNYLMAKRKIERIGIKINIVNRFRFHKLNEILSNVKLIKLYEVIDFFVNQFELISADYSKSTLKSSFIADLPKHIIELISVLLLTIIILFNYNQNGQIINILPKLSFYLLAFYRILPLIYKLSASLHNIVVTQDIVNDYTKIYYENAYEKTTMTKPLIFNNMIEFNDVSFGYDSRDTLVLNNINVSISKGEFIGVYGHSGSGKSTFIDLLLNLYQPSSGFINIDNMDINSTASSEYLKLFGYVQQDTYLLNGSILENIAIGVKLEEVDIPKLLIILDIVELYQFTMHEMKDTYNSNIGERGVQLSGGQKQRIGIARALYKDPQILIMDESTNSLDPNTENMILKNIQKLLPEKTIVIVSHKKSTLKNCNRVFNFENGRISEIDLK